MNTIPSSRLPIALLATWLLACPQAESRPRQPARDATRSEVEMLPQRGKVHLSTRDGREFALAVEIASDDPTRTRGLMFRKSMPEMAGMIFVFPHEAHHSFWMRNTLIPLDMLFIDAQGRVIGIVENAEPKTLTPRQVAGDSKFVLEVNGGWCSRHGVGRGDAVALEGMYDLR